MPLKPANNVEILDEGISQGFVRSVDFVGSGVSVVVSGSRATATITSGGGGGLTLTEVEVNLGSTGRYSGTFDITGLVGLTANKQVLIIQKAAAYTNKGNRQDEAEMDQVHCTGYVVDANTIRCYWTCMPHGGPMVGNVKFGYAVGA